MSESSIPKPGKLRVANILPVAELVAQIRKLPEIFSVDYYDPDQPRIIWDKTARFRATLDNFKNPAMAVEQFKAKCTALMIQAGQHVPGAPDQDQENVLIFWLKLLREKSPYYYPEQTYLTGLRSAAADLLEHLHVVGALSSPISAPAAKNPQQPRAKVDCKKLKSLRGNTRQEGLAEACGVAPITIRRGEAGKRWDDDTFAAVARGLTRMLKREITSAELKAKPQPPQ